MLQEAPDGDPAELARAIVDEHLAACRTIPGIGHPLHKPIDPRTPVLFDLAARHGLRGRHVALMEAVAAEGGAAQRANRCPSTQPAPSARLPPSWAWIGAYAVAWR